MPAKGHPQGGATTQFIPFKKGGCPNLENCITPIALFRTFPVINKEMRVQNKKDLHREMEAF